MKRKTVLLVVPALAGILGVGTYSRTAGGGTARERGPNVAAASYAQIMAAPPAPAAVVSNPRLRAMARLAGVDPAALRQLRPADQPLGALVAGRDSSGRVCVAEASEDVAGSFECDPFRDGPLHLIAGSRGTPSRVTWSGFVGVVDASVRRLSVRTAGGLARDVPLDAAGAFSYGGSHTATFPVELRAYAADESLILSAALPRAAPPGLG